MDLYDLKCFFMWCTIINSALILMVFLLFTFASNWIYRQHHRWFPISQDAFYVISYGFLGAYKILVFVFNLVPFLALLIVT